MTGRPGRIRFLVPPGVHLLDLSGPAQVFSAANDHGARYTINYLAEQAQVTAAQGLELRAGLEWPAPAAGTTIIVPGWRVGRAAVRLPFGRRALDLLRAQYAAGGTVASVCSGAEALAAAGLLDGRRFTTHHDIADDIAGRHPLARLVRDVLYVVDGPVVTSAGIASGIDLALHLVAVDHGPSLAARVARSLVVYARRNGDEPQTSVLLRHRAHVSDVVHRVQDRIDARFTERLSLTDLARHAGVSERSLTRAFTGATGMTPLRYQQALRLERAERLIGDGDTVDSAAHRVGFADARMLRRLRAAARSQVRRAATASDAGAAAVGGDLVLGGGQ